MKSTLKKYVKSNPSILKLYRRIHYGNLLKPFFTKEIKGNNNTLDIKSSAFLLKCKFDIVGDNNEIIIGDATFFSNVTFYIRGNNNKIHISDGVLFNNGGSFWIEDENCEVGIGAHTTFEDVHIAVTEPGSKITIGSNCMFAYDIDLRTGDSHSIIDVPTDKRTNYAQNITIGDNVWIASHVSILKGVILLPSTIVATRSVITKSFNKEHILLGGIPAKILKEDVRWDRKRLYER